MSADATRANRYDWILFDADETLFHFDAFAGLQLMFSRFGVDFSQPHYDDYQTINKPAPEGITPHQRVRSLREHEALLPLF
jgi:FMN phosphatase YigB (HAD superfamily)